MVTISAVKGDEAAKHQQIESKRREAMQFAITACYTEPNLIQHIYYALESFGFDIILGNIPFSSVKIYDRRCNDLNPYIHDYFSSSRWLSSNRVISTSKEIMDRKDETLREQ